MTNDVKNVLLRLNIDGIGVVNYDSNDQKWIMNQVKNSEFNKHNNVSYAKKNFYRDEEDSLSYKLKISSDCIRNAIFAQDMIAQSPNISHNDMVLNSFIGDPNSMIRGYMFAEKGKSALKRKSALTICDAEQTCNAQSYIETFARSGEKTTDENKADNTFFKKETVGEIKYGSIGSIDLQELQFVSCDLVFDRYAFNADQFNKFKAFLGTKMPNFVSELGYFQLKDSMIQIPEHGFKFSDENVVFMVKMIIEKLLNINIKRKNAFAKTGSIEIKLVTDPLVDTYENEDGWQKISSQEDVDKLDFSIKSSYEEVDLDEALSLRTGIEEKLESLKAEGKAKAKEEKAARSKAKKQAETTK